MVQARPVASTSGLMRSPIPKNRRFFHATDTNLAPKHFPYAKVKALAQATLDGLVSTCNVPVGGLFQLITLFESEQMILDQCFGGVERSGDACIVEVTFLRGRTDNQKRKLFQHVVARAQLA